MLGGAVEVEGVTAWLERSGCKLRGHELGRLM